MSPLLFLVTEPGRVLTLCYDRADEHLSLVFDERLAHRDGGYRFVRKTKLRLTSVTFRPADIQSYFMCTPAEGLVAPGQLMEGRAELQELHGLMVSPDGFSQRSAQNTSLEDYSTLRSLSLYQAHAGSLPRSSEGLAHDGGGIYLPRSLLHLSLSAWPFPEAEKGAGFLTLPAMGRLWGLQQPLETLMLLNYKHFTGDSPVPAARNIIVDSDCLTLHDVLRYPGVESCECLTVRAATLLCFLRPAVVSPAAAQPRASTAGSRTLRLQVSSFALSPLGEGGELVIAPRRQRTAATLISKLAVELAATEEFDRFELVAHAPCGQMRLAWWTWLHPDSNTGLGQVVWQKSVDSVSDMLPVMQDACLGLEMRARVEDARGLVLSRIRSMPST